MSPSVEIRSRVENGVLSYRTVNRGLTGVSSFHKVTNT